MAKKSGADKQSASKSMGEAVSDLREKQGKAQAAVAASGSQSAEAANGASVKPAVVEGVSAASALSATSQLLESYRELVATSTKTLDLLPPEDPARAELLEAVTAARAAWLELLFDGEEPPTEIHQSVVREDPGVASAEDSEPEPASTALVPVTPGKAQLVRRPRRYPDEAVLARYWRRRRARHEWPDEAAIKRYLRKRRERGPLYPDEGIIARRLRIWNEDI